MYEDKELMKIISKLFGNSMEIVGDANEIVLEHLDDLSLIPDPLAKELVNNHINLKLGARDMIGLSNDPYFHNNTPRGWNQENWVGVPGCYSPSKKIAYMGSGNHGGISLALHEVGHAIDDIFDICNDQKVIESHIRFFTRLKKYYKQGGPGGLAGRQEFFAESFAEYMLSSEEEFNNYYDKEWHDFLRKNF